MQTLGQILTDAGQRDRIALLSRGFGQDADATFTYGDMHRMIQDFQRAFMHARFPESSDQPVVSIMIPNSIEFVTAFLAVAEAGVSAAPLNTAYGEAELEFNLKDCQSRAIVIGASIDAHRILKVCQHVGHKMEVWQVALRRHRDVSWTVELKCCSDSYRVIGRNRLLARPNQVALILHTSGTTSTPKCVPLTHANILRTMQNVTRTYKLTPDDRTLVVMPLFHVHGLIGALLSTLYSGGSAVIVPKFSASVFWRVFNDNSCTWYSAVPTIHQILLRHDAQQPAHKVAGLRFIRSCSASLAPAVLKHLEEKYGAPVLEAYAMTEASHQMASNPLPPAHHKAGSVGVGQGVKVCILADDGSQVNQGGQGEVAVRGVNVTSGYRNRPKANAESFTKDGWFRTGDQGYMDKEGYLFLTGRLKELINRGGEKISPMEIDSVLLHHPMVSEAVAFAAPDDIYGEQVHAAVILNSKDDKVTESELIKYCNSKLAPFKCPVRIYISDSVPRTATGKIQRRHVAAHFLKAPSSKL